MGLLINRSVRVSFGIAGAPFTVVDKLFIQFEVEKTREKHPNRVTIQINNLNETSRATLENKDVFVSLEAGYLGADRQGKLGQLFIGKITRAISEKQGKEMVTRIEASDGQGTPSAQINTSLGPGATAKQVIESLARELKVGLGAIKGIGQKVFQNGISLSGNVSDRLDEILDGLELEWSIQDNNLQIVPIDEPTETLATLLTPQSGLLGTVMKREEGKAGKLNIEFRALLRTEIKPLVALEIRSRNITGVFKISKAIYVGDSRKGPFEVRCQATEIPTVAPISINTPLNIPAIGSIA